jgi:ankyrin repeat protein
MDQDLFDAAEENNMPEVRRLLRAGADVNGKDNYGSTPLIVACEKGHVQVVQVLRENGVDIEATTGLLGMTALHFACHNGHLAAVNELVSPNDINGTTSVLGKRNRQGVNIEAKDNEGDTPLHFASLGDHLPVVKALLSGGAEIFAANNRELLPIHSAVGNRNSAVTKYLLQHIYATTRRHPLHELVEDLTWIGDPNSSDVPPLFEVLREALHRNVLSTHDVVEILEYLVGRNPALLSSRDRDGSLPLHAACRRGASFAIVQSLVNLYKASVKTVTPQGDLPLFLACEMPETSLDTIFLLMTLYPDLVCR